MDSKHILAILFAAVSFLVHGNTISDRKLSDNAQISVITCGTGDQLYSLFGHTALRVYDPQEGVDRVYNYGMFDFRTDNFYGKFVKGNLLYFVDYERYRDFLANYVYDERTVYEQLLNLNQKQKQTVFDKLNESLREENKFYTYKFIDQNCTTKVVDIVNSVLPTPVKVDVEGNTESYRTILNSYLKNRYFEMLGINLIFGSKVNKTSDLLFLPDKFMAGLAETEINKTPLIIETVTVFQPETKAKSTWWNSMWFASILALFLGASLVNSFIRKTYLLVLGVLGVFFFAVGFYSLHAELLWNNSVLLCSPLFLALPFIKQGSKWRGQLNIAMLLSVFGFVFANLMSQKLWVSLPLVAVTLFAVILEVQLIAMIKQKK